LRNTNPSRAVYEPVVISLSALPTGSTRILD
jgi:hypothetical protein